MKKVNGFWVDIDDNSWDENNFTEEQSKLHSESLVNCKNCVNGTDCKDCRYCMFCIGCVGCIGCNNCKYAINCVSCNNLAYGGKGE